MSNAGIKEKLINPETLHKIKDKINPAIELKIIRTEVSDKISLKISFFCKTLTQT